jgi:hypothetical protein
MNRTLWPEILGFLAAAVFPTVMLAVLEALTTSYDLATVLVFSVLAFPVAATAVVMLGVPTFLVLRRFAPGQWWMPLVAGLILGMPLLLVLPGQLSLKTALTFVPLTALSALVFWLVWRWLSEREGAFVAS